MPDPRQVDSDVTADDLKWVLRLVMNDMREDVERAESAFRVMLHLAPVIARLVEVERTSSDADVSRTERRRAFGDRDQGGLSGGSCRG